MKKIVLILLISIICVFLVAFNSADGQDYSRYYTIASSQTEAEQIAKEMNATLISYVDGIASYSLNSPLKKTMNFMGVNMFNSEETGNLNGKKITLKQENVYYLDDFEAGTSPALNSGFDPIPFQAIRWENAYKSGIKGKGAIVAVIDTGCNIQHEDLKNNIAGTYNSVNGTTDVTDVEGHGTHVTGIIVAADNAVGNVGVAPEAKVFVIKASTTLSNGNTALYTSDIIKGLNKCIQLGYINVINMSLGSKEIDTDLKTAMENCANHGILCVSSAGNNATDSPQYPASFQIGLSVAASYQTVDDWLTLFSNYGINCNIVAPGQEIYSTYGDYYKKLSGTSMAAPYVSGVAALVYSQYDISKDRTGSEKVKNIIINNKNSITYHMGAAKAKGGLDVQNIFKSYVVRTPDKPKVIITEQSDTKQKIITVESSQYDAYYTLNGTRPTLTNGIKYTKPVRLDKAGKYKIRVAAINKGVISEVWANKITVSGNVIPQEKINNAELILNDTNKLAAGKSKQIQVSNGIPANLFKWNCNKTNIATVNQNGTVTVSAKAKSGQKFKIKAKIGDTTLKIKICVK